MTLPEIKTRPETHYVYVPFTVTMRQMQQPANEGFPLIFDYIGRNGLTPVGAAFYNYRRINMSETLDVEAGIAVAAPGPDEGRVRNGLLPAGRFAELSWNGHPDRLMDVTALLIGWLKQTGQQIDVTEKAHGDHFACRLEIYESDPAAVPDMNEWVTRLAFKLRG